MLQLRLGGPPPRPPVPDLLLATRLPVNRRVLILPGVLLGGCLFCGSGTEGAVAYPDLFTSLGGVGLAPRATQAPPPTWAGGGPWRGGRPVLRSGPLAQGRLPVDPDWPPDWTGAEGGIGIMPTGMPVARGTWSSADAASQPLSAALGLGDDFALSVRADVPQPSAIFVWTVLGLFVSLGVAQHRRARTLRTRLPWSAEQREAILQIVERNRPDTPKEQRREVDSPW